MNSTNSTPSTVSTPSSSPPTTTTTLSTASTSRMMYPTSPTNPGNEIGTWSIVGGVVGGAAALLIVILVVLFFLWRRKRQTNQPPMLPDPYPRVNLQPNTGSTTILVDNQVGTSADDLPIAPPPPKDFDEVYEPPDTDSIYVNKDPEPVESEGYYIPMQTNSETGMHSLENPQAGPDTDSYYVTPDSARPTPSFCKGSFNKGYVNVPHSVGTLPKYANVEKKKTKEAALEEEEEEEEENYENITGTKPRTSKLPPNPPISSQLMAEILVNNSPKNSSPGRKTSPKPPKSKVSHNKQNSSSGSSASSTPKAKHRASPKPCSKPEGGDDYVNIKQYSKVDSPRK